MNSMTGFGSAAGKEGGFDVRVEIRSVNHRFFSLKQSLPEGLQRYDGEIEKILRSRIERGSMTVNVALKSHASPARSLPDPKTVKEVVARLKAIQKSAGVKGEIGMETLLAVPHLWATADGVADEEAAWPSVKGLVERAAKDLVSMRSREGAAIAKDIEMRLDAIEATVGKIEKRAPAILENYQRKLEDRITALLTQRGLELSKTDVLKEIAVYADKCDVSEELQRLRSHVEQFRKILKQEGAIGRRLDFLTQEMNREANTLTAKSNDAEISIHAVEIKAELEKIKEQSENVE